MNRPYETPILDEVAARAFAQLVLHGRRGTTVTNLAREIGANRSTLGNVLRGASAFGTQPFERCGTKGLALLWRARIYDDSQRPQLPLARAREMTGQVERPEA